MKRSIRLAATVLVTLLAVMAAQPASAHAPLRTLSVRLTDLGHGYVVANGLMPSGLQKASFTAFRASVSTKALKAHGWASAYHVEFQGKKTVNNDIVEFASTEGARWFFVEIAHHVSHGAGNRAVAFPRVGDMTTGYAESGSFYGIIVQRGQYVEDIAMRNGSRATLLRLARAVAHRMAAQG